jgi:hypothetical protein
MTSQYEGAAKSWAGPSLIHVFVTIAPSAKRGLRDYHTGRVGSCRTPEEVPALIAKDMAAMGYTFGGLIEPSDSGGRTYRAFRARWEELDVATTSKVKA